MSTRQPCRFFALGRCTRGQACSFAHVVDPQIPAWDVRKRQKISQLFEDHKNTSEEIVSVPVSGARGSAVESADRETLQGVNGGIRCVGVDGSESTTRVYRRGHVMGSSGELYVELVGDCRVRILIPARTLVTDEDRDGWKFSGPVNLAGEWFESVQGLRQRINSILYSRAKAGDTSPLCGHIKNLLLACFANHPDPNKLVGVQDVKVGANPRGGGNPCFWLMRNDNDGEEISVVKCLRALYSKLLAGTETEASEMMEVVATISVEQGTFTTHMAGLEPVKNSCDVSPVFAIGVRLEDRLLSVDVGRCHKGFGPCRFMAERCLGSDLYVALSVDQISLASEVTVNWAPPFKLRQDTNCAAGTHMSLREVLATTLKDLGSKCDLSVLSDDELSRAVGRAAVDAIDDAQRISQSGRSVMLQARCFAAMATQAEQALCRIQLHDERALRKNLQTRLESQRAVEHQLREDLKDARRVQSANTTNNSLPDGEDATRRPSSTVQEEANLQGVGGLGLVDKEGSASFVTSLRQKILRPIDEPHLSMLRSSLKLVSAEMYSDPMRALWELVQNADDCRYEEQSGSLNIVQTQGYIWLQYNEIGFKERDVEALCNVGASMKGKGQTGRKGIGFKASFLLSGRPHVLSPPYRFFFDEEDQECFLPQVTPSWLEDVSELPEEMPSCGTAIYLPLRFNSNYPKLVANIQPTDLLFLRRLRSISISGFGMPSYSFVRTGESVGFVEIATRDDGNVALGRKETFFLARCECPCSSSRSFGGADQDSTLISVAFVCEGNAPEADTVFSTLPLSPVPGLRTPLDAPFDLTSSREALQVGSQRNAELRDALAELWLQTISDSLAASAMAFAADVNSKEVIVIEEENSKLATQPPWAALRRKHRGVSISDEASERAVESETRSSLVEKVLQFQPGTELLSHNFWGPFAQRVRAGLLELALIPVIGIDEHGSLQERAKKCRRLPMSKCRLPGGLIRTLNLKPSDVDILGLGIVDQEVLLQQLGKGGTADGQSALQEILTALPGLLAFSPNDVIDLIISEADASDGKYGSSAEVGRRCDGPWRRGEEWRSRAVAALANKRADVNAAKLREVPLFPLLGDSSAKWHSCGKEGIFCTVPSDAPSDLLKVLDSTKATPADNKLLSRLGYGLNATVRDVAFAIVHLHLGLKRASDNDRRTSFSWTNLAFIGKHWTEILQSPEQGSSQQAGLDETRKMLQDALCLPSCGSTCLHNSSELQCPFFLGSHPRMPNNACAIPPAADSLLNRLEWELTFIRLGVRPCAADADICLSCELFKDAAVVSTVLELLSCYQIQAGLVYSSLRVRDNAGIERVTPVDFGKVILANRDNDNLADVVDKLEQEDAGLERLDYRLLGPLFEPLIGPDFVVDVGDSLGLRAIAMDLISVVWHPTASLVADGLMRAVRHNRVKAAYLFLANEWQAGRFSEEELQNLKNNGLPLPESRIGSNLEACPVHQLAWRPQLCHVFGKSGILEKFFIQGLGVAKFQSACLKDPILSSRHSFNHVPESHGDASGIQEPNVVLPGGSDFKISQTELDTSTQEERPHKISHAASDREGYTPLVEETAEAETGDEESNELPPLPVEAGTGAYYQTESTVSNKRKHCVLPSNLLSAIFKEEHGCDALWGCKAPPHQQLSLEKIYFTQRSVSQTFLHGQFAGRSVRDVGSDIASGTISSDTLPMAVMSFRNCYWTLNNRSLLALRLAQKQSGSPILADCSVFSACPATAKFIELVGSDPQTSNDVASA